MASQSRSITAVLRAEIGQYKQAMDEAAKATEKVKKSTEGVGKGTEEAGKKAGRSAAQIKKQWADIGKPMVAVGGAITAVGVAALKTGISYNTLQQQSRAALTTLTGSAQAANAQMDKLDEFAKSSPFSKQTFITAQQQMMAFGIETRKVIPYLDAVQDAVAAAGGGNQQISEVAYVMSQISAASKITATDLMQFGQRGINAAELIGDSMGKTGAQIRSEITAGTLDADDALDALAKGMESRYGGAADNVKNTFVGALDRVKAAWRDLSSDLAEPFVGKEGGGLFTGLLNEVADFMRRIEELPGPVKAAVAGITGLGGVGALAAGSFLLLAPRIVETKAALDVLKTSSPGAYGALTGVGKAAAIATAAFAGLSIAGSFMSNDQAGSGINEMTAAIQGLSIGAGKLEAAMNSPQWDTKMFKGLDGLAGVISDADRSTSGLNKTLGLVNMNMFEDSAADVENYDAALAKMVSDGKIKEAAEGAEYFYKQAEEGGVSLETAEGMLKQYRDALAGLDEDQRAAAEAGLQLSESMQGAFDALADPTAAIQSAETLDQVIAKWREQAEAARNFSSNINQALAMGLDPAIIDDFAASGEAGMQRLADAVAGGPQKINELNDAYRGLGTTVEDVSAMTAAASRVAEIRLETKGGPEAVDQIMDVVNASDLTPEQVRTLLEAQDFASADIEAVLEKMKRIEDAKTVADLYARDEAAPILKRLGGMMSALNGRSATVHVFANTAAAIAAINAIPGISGPLNIFARVAMGNADGGFYSGGVKRFADGGVDEYGRQVPRIPQLRSGSQGAVMWGEAETGWEAYVSGKPGMQNRNRAILGEAAARLGGDVTWYANGGIEGGDMSAAELTRLRIRIRDLERDLRAGGKDRLRGLDRVLAQQELREAKSELAHERSAKRRIPRGYSADSWNATRDRAADMANDFDSAAWSSPASLERFLTNKLAESAQFTQVLADLKKKGASPWLLEQLIAAGPSKASIRTARALISDTARLKRLNAMSGQLGQVSDIYGRLTDPRFLQAGSNWGSFNAAQQSVLERNVNLTVNSVDNDKIARDVERLVKHHLGNSAMGAGI